jgi:IS5 family transposase
VSLPVHLFRARSTQILHHEHEWYRRAGAIGWELFEEAFGPLFVENKGTPGLATRLMVGLHYLK